MRRSYILLAIVGSLALLAGTALEAVANGGGYGYGGHGYGGGYGCGSSGYGGYGYGGYERGGYGGGGYERGGYGYGNRGYGCRRGYCNGLNRGPGRSFREPVGRFQPRRPVQPQGRAPQPKLNRPVAPQAPQPRRNGPVAPQAPGNNNLAPPAPGGAGGGPDLQSPQAPRPIVIPDNVKDIGLLPRADQASALAQKTCPVTGGLLGVHGKPIKVLVQGQVIFVCCKGCVNDLTANPQEFLKQRP